MLEPKIWEPVSELQMLARLGSGRLVPPDQCSDEPYLSILIGRDLSDAYGYSIMEICTGEGRETDVELARLVLSLLENASSEND
jgi:hypothetical protein